MDIVESVVSDDRCRRGFHMRDQVRSALVSRPGQMHLIADQDRGLRLAVVSLRL
jgi:hypothetical protein